jgi:pimeloyl-ACP methyl ester carboxylesterase
MINNFTSHKGTYPNAEKHTQWPGNGADPEDPVLFQFAASQVEYLADNETTQRLILDIARPLLEKTGPAILVVHSQAGRYGWLISDSCYESVRGLVALEPSGPPFTNGKNAKFSENYGLTDFPLHFDPPVSHPSELEREWRDAPEPGKRSFWTLKEHTRTLPRFRNIPVLIVTAEASYHHEYDYLTHEFLTRAGVAHDFISLETLGIHGNGHMMMMEKNNLEIASVLAGWLKKKIG